METLKVNPLKRFWMLLRPDKLEIRNVYIYAIFNGLINLSLPVGIQAIINLIQGGAVNTSWIILVIFVSGGIALGGILQISQLRITENLQQKIFTRAAFEFAYRIPRIKLEKIYREYAPELMNRFFDVVSVQKGLSKILVDFSSASIQVVFGLILLSIYHPFFIIFSIFLLVVILLMIRLTARRGLETSLDESKRKYQTVHWLEELSRANYSFKLAGETDLPLHEVNVKTSQYISAREQHFSVLKKQYALMVAFKVLVALGLLVLGGILVMEQQMNIGQFVAAEIIILLIINSVEKLILNFETIYDVLTSLEKIGQVTDLELDSEDGVAPKRREGAMCVELSSVQFTYPDEDKVVLDDVSLRVESGERMLVTGQNDSGKSTMLYLIGGLFQPTSGTILIDDIPTGNYRPDALRSMIGGYLRDETLFEGTLLDNITLGRPKATFENVKWAIKGLGLQELIKTLPLGYNTRILPHGRQFSKSTVAKLMVARAIADKPSVLLLENSFSIFSETDRDRILTFLLDRSHEWTVLLTSSQPIDLGDLIDRELVLEKGKIIEER